MTEEQVRLMIRQELAQFIGIGGFKFDKNLQILDGRNVQLGLTSGTKIGTGVAQKIGFYGVVPVVQASTIANPSGSGVAGVDNSARTAIVSIITALHNMGIIA